jgi:hypothetical protein
MPAHIETYRGHRIEVETVSDGRFFGWTYLIDATITGRSATRAKLTDEAAALRRGLLAARARVDELG